MRIIAIIKLKQYIIQAGVFKVIVDKFRYWLKSCLVILLPIYKKTKLCFHFAVLLFCLAVFLKVEYSQKLSFNVKKVVEQKLELEHNNCFIVTNNRVRARRPFGTGARTRVRAGVGAGAQTSKTVLRILYKSSLKYLRTLIATTGASAIKSFVPEGLTGWLNNLSSDSKGEEESRRATEEVTERATEGCS